MTDYLTPEYRATMREDYAEVGCVTDKEGMQLLAHAAEADRRIAERDRVMRLLSEALRDAITEGTLCDCWRCTNEAHGWLCEYGVRARNRAEDALAKYEKLIGAGE